MKDILKNSRMLTVSFCACISIFIFFFLVFFSFGNNLISKFYIDTFIPIFFSSVLLTVLLYNFLRKHKRLLHLVAIPGILMLILGVIGLVIGTYFPRQNSKEYEVCRETAANTYKQALKDKGYSLGVSISDLKKEDQWLWTKYLDELPKCGKYK